MLTSPITMLAAIAFTAWSIWRLARWARINRQVAAFRHDLGWLTAEHFAGVDD